MTITHYILIFYVVNLYLNIWICRKIKQIQSSLWCLVPVLGTIIICKQPKSGLFDKYYFLMIHHESDTILILNEEQYTTGNHLEVDCYLESKRVDLLIKTGEQVAERLNYTFDKTYTPNKR